MTTVSEIGWASYGGYEGPYYKGTNSFTPSSNPTEGEKVLAVITSTEGGRASAINCYDRCICSLGYIQLCENGIFGASDLLGFIAQKSISLYGKTTLLDELKPALNASNAKFGTNAKGKWRFFFNDSRGEVDTTVEQKQLFLLHSTGEKGTWDQASKDHAKLWASCLANTLQRPEAVQAQIQYLLPKIQGYTYGEAKTILLGETNLPNEGWVGATRAAYLSFAINLPAVAANHAAIGAKQSSAPKWSKDWCVGILKQMTFGPGIAIYPARYNAIRPVIEKLYGIDLPDFATELQKWKVDHSVTTDDFTTVASIQKELIAEGYDLGPAGADGQMGPKSTAAIRTFQGLHGLTADGVVGPKTRQALMTEASKRNP